MIPVTDALIGLAIFLAGMISGIYYARKDTIK